MHAKQHKPELEPAPLDEDIIYLNRCQVLSDVVIDDLAYKVTLCPFHPEACILWHRDQRLPQPFRALGRFTVFDKRTVLDFIVRFTLTPELREEIERRRFTRRIVNLSPEFFRRIDLLTPRQKDRAFRDLFDLDNMIQARDLAVKRRIMAKHFHPDTGGDPGAMRVINEAFDYLSQTAIGSPVKGAGGSRQ